MTNKELLYDISKMIEAHFGIESDQITFESHLENDLGLDSLDKIELVMEIEKEYDIYIEDSEMEIASEEGTVQSIIDLIPDI